MIEPIAARNTSNSSAVKLVRCKIIKQKPSQDDHLRRKRSVTNQGTPQKGCGDSFRRAIDPSRASMGAEINDQNTRPGDIPHADQHGHTYTEYYAQNCDRIWSQTKFFKKKAAIGSRIPLNVCRKNCFQRPGRFFFDFFHFTHQIYLLYKS